MKRIACIILAAGLAAAAAPAPTSPIYCITVEANGRTVQTYALDGARSLASVAANVRNAILAAGLPDYPIAPASPTLPPDCPARDGCNARCTYYTECGAARLKGGVIDCVSGGGCTCVRVRLLCVL